METETQPLGNCPEPQLKSGGREFYQVPYSRTVVRKVPWESAGRRAFRRKRSGPGCSAGLAPMWRAERVQAGSGWAAAREGSRHAQCLRQGAARPRAGSPSEQWVPSAPGRGAEPRTRPSHSHPHIRRSNGSPPAWTATPPEPNHLLSPLPTAHLVPHPHPLPTSCSDLLLPQSHLPTHLPLAAYTPVELFTVGWCLLAKLFWKSEVQGSLGPLHSHALLSPSASLRSSGGP